MRKSIVVTLVMLMALRSAGQHSASTNSNIKKKHSQMTNAIQFKTAKIDGLNIFYREAGEKSKPTLLLLHGFPSSSHMYRDLIADLAGKYHIIAPDYPGFGQSSAPTPQEYAYTFDNLAKTTEHLIDYLGLKKINLYMQDYGGPIGFRIATNRSELIQSLIIQNANVYNEGLGEALGPLVAYIQNPNPETEKAARGFLSIDATKWQYTDGAEDATKVSPDSYTLDQFYLDRKGNDQIQLALFRDYGSNLPKYDEWHQYLKLHTPPTLVIWGKNDKLFVAAGGDAYRKDVPKAEIHQLNGGHFLLEEHHAEAAKLIDSFISKIK